MRALPKTDYFVDPNSGKCNASAPFYYNEVEGDFVFKAKVSHDFVSIYDACALFAFENEKLWTKACFEYTDIMTHAVVCVMTNQYSDDANCINTKENKIWLQLSRKNNIFAVHYSLDGESYYMARITRLPMKSRIKVGVVAQSPLGTGGSRVFDFITLEQRTIENIRFGK